MTNIENRYKECFAGFRRAHSAETAGVLAALASDLRNQGRHLGAAICSLSGHHEAWGVEPHELCQQLLGDGINDLLRFLRNDGPEDLHRILALELLAMSCNSSSFFFFPDAKLQLAQIQETAEYDYCQLLHRIARGHPSEDALLVSGFQLRGCLDGHWELVFPGVEVIRGEQQIEKNTRVRTIGMPSVFNAMVSLADYDGALKVSLAHEEALITPGLRGWSIASAAFVSGDSNKFADASAQFSLDSPDRIDRKETSWTGVNQQLWAPYFRSRSHMAKSCATSEEAVENLRKANDFIPQLWENPQVSRYAQIIGAVCRFADRDGESLAAAVHGYQRSLRLHPSPLDGHVMNFLGHLQTLSEVTVDGNWLEPLSQLIELLDRLPILTVGEKSSIRSAFNQLVPSIVFGVNQGWECKALTSITDERQLHRILLAIFRAEARVPLFSQIRHGPIEYGKDIVVCREEDGRRILWMYSAKIGVVKKAAWNADVRPQLEEIFQVPLDLPDIIGKIDERVGVLVLNDHIHPYAEPLVMGWMKDQRETFDRRYELMHIDRLVKYVAEKRLGATLRLALRAEGLLT